MTARRPLLRLGDPLDADLDRGHLAADLRLDAVRELGVRFQEVARVLATLAEARLAVVEPRAGLRQDARGDADVEQATLAADPLVVHDVELGQPEGARHLVLDHLDAGSRPDRIGPALEGLDTPNVEAPGAVAL